MKIVSGINPSYSGVKQSIAEISWNRIKKTERRPSESIAAAPARDLTFRKLSMPFGDKKKCRELIKEELEYSLAFPLKDASWDFIISPDGSAMAFAVPSSRAVPLKEARIIDTEITSLIRACLWCGHENALIIDAGASKTCAIVIKDGFPENAAVILLGGSEADEKIAKQLGCSLQEAESVKIREGLNNGIFNKLTERILQSVKDRIKESFSEIIVTGGLFMAEGSAAKASEFFKAPASALSLPEGFSPYTEAATFGAIIRERYPALAVNLGEKKEKPEAFPVLYAAALAIPMVLLSVHTAIESSYWKHRAAGFALATKKEIAKDFPDKKIVKPSEQLSQEIRKLKKRSAGTNLKYLEFISDIGEASNLINNRKDLRIYDITLSKSDASFSGEAYSLSDAEQIREELSKKYPDAKIVEGKTLQSKKIKFTIKLSINKKSKKSRRQKN